MRSVEAHDPYIAPGMEKWQWIYRSGHELLMPTGIVETKRMKDESAWKEKLFILDTGSETNLISPAAAKEVTKVSRDEAMGYAASRARSTRYTRQINSPCPLPACSWIFRA